MACSGRKRTAMRGPMRVNSLWFASTNAAARNKTQSLESPGFHWGEERLSGRAEGTIGVVIDSDESLAAREGDVRPLDNEVYPVEPLDDGDEEVSDCEEDVELSKSQPRSLVTLKTLSRFGSKPNSSG